jgi:Ca-activated chloride channel family protein
MNANHRDPVGKEQAGARLTAFALGQLPEKERAAVAEEIAASTEDQETVRVTQTLAKLFTEAARRDGTTHSPTLRGVLEERFRQLEREAQSPPAPIAEAAPAEPLAEVARSPKLVWSRNWRVWAGVAAACVLVVVVPMALSGRGDAARETASGVGALPPAPAPVAASPSERAVAGSASPLVDPQAKSGKDDANDRRDTVVAQQDRATQDATTPAPMAPAPGLEREPKTAVAETKADPAKTAPAKTPSKLFVPLEPDAGRPGVPVAKQPVPDFVPWKDFEWVPKKGMPRKWMPGTVFPVPAAPRELADWNRRPMIVLTPGLEVLPAEAAVGPQDASPIVENEFLSVAEHPRSTFAADVDAASYANVRRFLQQGVLPPPQAVRVEEMVNYFAYNDAGPQDNAPFAVKGEAAQCPWAPQHQLLRIALTGRPTDRRPRQRCNLVFLIDVARSMDEPEKLPLVQEALRLLARDLAKDDRLSIVASSGSVLLKGVAGDQRQEILAAIDALKADERGANERGANERGADESGAVGKALRPAFEQARRSFQRGGVNRVLVATDARSSLAGNGEAERLLKAELKSGVSLAVLGLGAKKDAALEKFTTQAGGTFDHLDSLRGARRFLAKQLTSGPTAAARDVKVQVEFNPKYVETYRLIGYENRRLAEAALHDERVAGGEIAAGQTVVAFYEIVPYRSGVTAADGPPLKYQKVARNWTEAAAGGDLFTLRVSYLRGNERESQLSEFAVKQAAPRPFREASADFRFGASVTAMGMYLRNSAFRGAITLKAIEEAAAGAVGSDPDGSRAEFVDLVRKAREIVRQ